jgi:hypothetical protein
MRACGLSVCVCLFIMQSKTSTGSFVSQRHQQRVPQKSTLTIYVCAAPHPSIRLVHALLSFRNPTVCICRVMMTVTAAGKNDTSCADNANKWTHILNDLLLRTPEMDHISAQRDPLFNELL